eukprot:1184464-Prorocentrum_minimum.AAC.2
MSTGYSGDKGALAQNEALAALRDKLQANTKEPPRVWTTDNAKSNKTQVESCGALLVVRTSSRICCCKQGAKGVDPSQQFVRVQATRKGKGGKTVTIISGIEGELLPCSLNSGVVTYSTITAEAPRVMRLAFRKRKEVDIQRF